MFTISINFLNHVVPSGLFLAHLENVISMPIITYTTINIGLSVIKIIDIYPLNSQFSCQALQIIHLSYLFLHLLLRLTLALRISRHALWSAIFLTLDVNLTF